MEELAGPAGGHGRAATRWGTRCGEWRDPRDSTDYQVYSSGYLSFKHQSYRLTDEQRADARNTLAGLVATGKIAFPDLNPLTELPGSTGAKRGLILFNDPYNTTDELYWLIDSAFAGTWISRVLKPTIIQRTMYQGRVWGGMTFEILSTPALRAWTEEHTGPDQRCRFRPANLYTSPGVPIDLRDAVNAVCPPPTSELLSHQAMFSLPEHGFLQFLPERGWRYTPHSYVADTTDTVVLSVYNTSGYREYIPVTISILSVPTCQATFNQRAERGVPVFIPLAGSDRPCDDADLPLGDAVSPTADDLGAVAQPAHGTLTYTTQNGVPGMLYTANADYLGTDQFQVRAKDALGGRSPSATTISLTVTHPAPVCWHDIVNREYDFQPADIYPGCTLPPACRRWAWPSPTTIRPRPWRAGRRTRSASAGSTGARSDPHRATPRVLTQPPAGSPTSRCPNTRSRWCFP